jgi:prevent-host-death family protein
MADEVGIAELKRRFSELLDRVVHRHELVVIQKRGRNVAAMVPLDEIDEIEERGKRRGLLAAVGAWADYPDPDEFLRVIRKSRDRAKDRKTEPLS